MPFDPVRVMVVGGHPVIRGVVGLACASIPGGELVGEAERADGIAGVLHRSAPDLVVLDLDLEDTIGVEALRILFETGYRGDVLVLADKADGSLVFDALRMGASGYLTKSDGLRGLGEAMRRVAAGERVVAPELERVAVKELGRFAKRAREGSDVHSALTSREHEILLLLAEGLTMQQIGRRLGISPRTVESHVAKIYRKLSVRTRVQAVARAASLGLIQLR
jgi:DNA-binding NarL/FixJ family response regulator